MRYFGLERVTEIVTRRGDLGIAGPMQRTGSTPVSGIKHLPSRHSVRA